jgi:malonyl CoA-acyl carrier protein transacylase
MVESGVERFVEIGPGSVLCGLSRRNARGTVCSSAGTPGGIQKLLSSLPAAGGDA